MSVSDKLAMIVEFWAAEGKADELKAALLALVPPTRKEDGCELYDLHVDRADGDRFAFYEVWRDKAAHAAHDETAHVALIRTQLPALTREKPRKVLLMKVEPNAA